MPDCGDFRAGARFYASALRENTTTNLTADEIHAIGLREVTRIEGQMDKLPREVGCANGTVQARFDRLNAKLLRARCLVVDTGLHAKRWTRQHAIDYGIQLSEVDRYVGFPGRHAPIGSAN
jgi:uncharacterized protein (DUF885 family)